MSELYPYQINLGAPLNISGLTSVQYLIYNSEWTNYTRTNADVINELGYTPSHTLANVSNFEITTANTNTNVFSVSVSSGNYLVYVYFRKGSQSTTNISLTWYNSNGIEMQAYFLNESSYAETSYLTGDFTMQSMFINSGSNAITLIALDSIASNLYVSAVLIKL